MKRKFDEERYFGTFSQVNIYVVDTKELSRFLNGQSLLEHYQDWIESRIYSSHYIMNALKNKMQSIEFNSAYYLMKTFGVHNKLMFDQNAFYELSMKDVEILLTAAKNRFKEHPKHYVLKNHIQKLERLVQRYTDGKLHNKTLLISTW